MKRGAVGTSLLILALVVAVGAARLGYAAFQRHQAAASRAAVQPGQVCPVGVEDYGGPDLEVLGDQDAVVEALWVLPPHELTREVLDSIEETRKWVNEHPKLVNLTIAVLKAKEAEPVLKKHGQNCAGLTINGQSKFRLWDKAQGKFKDVAFEKAPGPYSYTGHDIIDLLEQYLENTGHLPRNRTLGQEKAMSQPTG